MRRLLIVFCFVMGFAVGLTAQSNFTQTNYRMGQTTFTDISATGTPIAMTNPASGASTTPQEVGFNFTFNGQVFTQFMIHADGILRLGTSAPGASTEISSSPASSYSTVFSSTAANFQNVIMPFFTDLVEGSSTPQFHVFTSGTAPNRVCTVQWKNLRDADNTDGTLLHQFTNLEFQVKLYETTNDIEFIYGTYAPSGLEVLGRFAASGIKATSTSYLSLFRTASTVPYGKTVCLNAANHSRLTASGSYAFRKNNIPPQGFTHRFFGQINIDVGVGRIYYDALAPKGAQSPGRIEVLIRNEGTTAVSNIDVTLNITGANAHNALVNIANLPAGDSQNISFPEYNLANKGEQTVEVSVAAAGDTRIENNTLSVNQGITESGTQTPDITNAGTGIGFNGATGYSAIKMYGTGTRKIRQIRLPFSTYRNAISVSIREDEGANGSPSSTAPFTTSNFFTTTENFMMVIPITSDVTVTGDYYIVVRQTTTVNMGWRSTIGPPIRQNRNYTSTTGTTWGQATDNTPWEYIAQVYEENAGPDIGVEQVISPGCVYSEASDVILTLRNFSSNPIDFAVSPATITGKVRNPAGVEVPFSFQKNSGNLEANGVEQVTVLTGYDFTSRGYHLFSARTNLATDVEKGNDSLHFFIGNQIPVTKSISDPVCPLAPVTLTGPSYLASLQWNVDGSFSGGTTRLIQPVKTTVVVVTGIDYRGCQLRDSIIVEVKADGLPPVPVLMFGDTVLSHRNGFKDTVRVQTLQNHSIQWFGGAGTVMSDSANVLANIAGMGGAKVAAAYIRTSDGCANLSDTLVYSYAPGVLQNENSTIVVADTAFYDAGGPIFSTGSNFTRTFTPAIPGTKVKLTFYRLDLASFSSLSVYDGPSSSSPRIVALNNTQNGVIEREFISSSETGALTVQFSLGSSNTQGWWAGLTNYTPQVYRTVADGNWITAANWERKLPGGAFTLASRPPVKGDDSVYIHHNITLSSSMPMDQVLVEDGATFNIENPNINFISMPAYKTVNQPEFLVKGTMSISSRVQIFGGGGEMIVQGRLNNFGQIDFDSVVFNGSAPQIFGNFSGASGSMNRLHMDNPAGLTMGSDQEVTGIRFVNGLIHTNSENIITLQSEANSDNEGHHGSFVNGPLIVESGTGSITRLFPIGSNGKYRPVLLENSSSSGEATERFTAEFIEGPPPTRNLPSAISKVSQLRFCRITRSGNVGSNFMVTLPYLEDDGVTDHANLTLAKDDGSGNWLDIGGTASGAAPGFIQSGAFNGFSDFVLANNSLGVNPLPVVWKSFTARAVLADAHLEWQTTRERQCTNFMVERSMDGSAFSAIGSRKCENTSGSHTYRFVDLNPGKGSFYYRLRQVDADGSFEYSAIRKVSFGEHGIISAYPNPAKDFLRINNLPANSDVRLYDASGRMVVLSRKAGPATMVGVSHLPAGVYQLVITSSTGERLVQKVQVIK